MKNFDYDPKNPYFYGNNKQNNMKINEKGENLSAIRF